MLPSLAAALLLAAGHARAAERMEAGSNLLKPAAVQAGGGVGAESTSHRLDSTVEPVGGRTASESYTALLGARRLLHYPNTVTGLTVLAGVNETAATLQWSAPGADGAWGSLPAGSSYYIVVASYTVPDPFRLANARSLPTGVVASTAAARQGVVDSAEVSTLHANTTWFAVLWTVDADGGVSFASPRSTITTLARKPVALAEHVYEVGDTSLTIRWASLPAEPSSMSAAGFVLEASSTDFGAYLPGGVVYSSVTRDVSVSTLAVGVDVPLAYCTTYYFRVGTLNWAGATNYIALSPRPTYDDDAVQTTPVLLDIGPVPVGAAPFVLGQSVTVENIGRCPATYRLSATTTTTGSPWRIGASAGIDAYALRAGFSAEAPVVGGFGDEDLLSDAEAAAGPAAFAIGQTGLQVPRGETRTLWFRLEMPAITSTEDMQDITVTVRAVRDPP